MMKIGIIGAGGIPNQYGGFEQFAEKFSVRMVERGHDVTVYCSHKHPYKKSEFRGVKLIHCFDPEHVIGTPGQFIYDLNCIKDCRRRDFDIILQLGYTSSTVWSWLFPKSAMLVTNMDGLEWSRAKYNKPTQLFLTYAEKWGVRYSDHLIADSKGIQDYLIEKYGVKSALIPYGAELHEPAENDMLTLKQYSLSSNDYDLLVARFEPENNIETVLKAYAVLRSKKLVLVGNYSKTKFGRRMFREYDRYSNIEFIGANYDTAQLNVLRYHSRLYLHGHSVGGTNPSLLEAMACDALVCAHENRFNRYVLGNDAFYFSDCENLLAILSGKLMKENHLGWLSNNRQKISSNYNWEAITENIEFNFKRWKFGEEVLEIQYAM